MLKFVCHGKKVMEVNDEGKIKVFDPKLKELLKEKLEEEH